MGRKRAGKVGKLGKVGENEKNFFTLRLCVKLFEQDLTMKFSELVQKLGEAAACNSLTSNNDCDPEITEWQLLSKQLPVPR